MTLRVVGNAAVRIDLREITRSVAAQMPLAVTGTPCKRALEAVLARLDFAGLDAYRPGHERPAF